MESNSNMRLRWTLRTLEAESAKAIDRHQYNVSFAIGQALGFLRSAIAIAENDAQLLPDDLQSRAHAPLKTPLIPAATNPYALLRLVKPAKGENGIDFVDVEVVEPEPPKPTAKERVAQYLKLNENVQLDKH